MANKLYEENSVQAIADAIRGKNGETTQYTIAEMASAIDAIETAPALAIVSQPISATVKNGETAYFTIGAIGKNVQYQWQFYVGGGAWSNTGLPGNKTSKLTVDSTGRNGVVYRCVVSDETGFIESNSATLNTYKDPSLMETNATPTKSQQVLTPPTGIDGFSKLTVEPIPSQYIIPAGSTTITENGTHPVTEFAQVVVDVQGDEPIGEWDAGLLASNEIGTQTGIIAQIASALVGKGAAGGLEFETGVFEPTVDTAGNYRIPFAKTHEKLPTFVNIADSTESDNTTTTGIIVGVLFNVIEFNGNPIGYGASTKIYLRNMLINKNGETTITSAASNITSDSNVSSLLDANGFQIVASASGRNYIAGRTYKWIAIWT